MQCIEQLIHFLIMRFSRRLSSHDGGSIVTLEHKQSGIWFSSSKDLRQTLLSTQFLLLFALFSNSFGSFFIAGIPVWGLLSPTRTKGQFYSMRGTHKVSFLSKGLYSVLLLYRLLRFLLLHRRIMSISYLAFPPFHSSFFISSISKFSFLNLALSSWSRSIAPSTLI